MARKRKRPRPARWRKLLSTKADPSVLDRKDLSAKALARWAIHYVRCLDKGKQVAFLVDAVAKLTPRLTRMCHTRDPAVQREGDRLKRELQDALSELRRSESSIEQVGGTRTKSPEQLQLGSD